MTVAFCFFRTKPIRRIVMDVYHSTQVAANVAAIFIPVYFILRKKSSKRTKKIAAVILAFVLLSLFGQLGAKLSGTR